VKEFLVYTGLRLALFAGSLAIIVGVWSVVSADGSVPLVWAAVLAFLVSGIASYFLLYALRERFAQKVSARAERATAAFDQRRAAEDAAEEAAARDAADASDADSAPADSAHADSTRADAGRADGADAALPPEDRRP
jgi:hypothetical protein